MLQLAPKCSVLGFGFLRFLSGDIQFLQNRAHGVGDSIADG